MPVIPMTSTTSCNHCPSCGFPDITKRTDRSVQCARCGYHLYFNTAAAVAGLILDRDGRLLLAVRGRDPMKGMLDLPGGFVDAAETAEEALCREVMEELNIRITGLRYFASFPNTYLYKGITYNTLDLAFLCESDELHNIHAADDVEECFFVPLKEIDPDKIGFDSIKKIVSRFISEKGTP